MHTLSINTAVANDFVFDPALIEHVSGTLRLKSQAAAVNAQYDMSSDAPFTYDNTKLEFVTDNDGNTVARLKDQRVDINMFYASFNSATNANYGNGSLIAALTGAPVINTTYKKFGAGSLDLTGDAVRFVQYAGEGNLHWTTPQMCVSIQYRPQYSGTPGSKKTVWSMGRNADLKNYIELYHSNADGHLKCLCYDSDGTQIADWDFGEFNPTSGTFYNLELNVNLGASSAIRLFIDGTQLGSTMTGTGTRSDEIDFIRIGTDRNGTATAECYVDEFIVFTTVQHTDNFTAPTAEQPQTIYVIDSPSITLTEQITNILGIDSYSLFTALKSEAGVNVVTGAVSNDNGVSWMYWDPANHVWAVSSGVGTSSDLDDINENIDSFSVGSGLRFRIYFTSAGNFTPSLNDVTVTYTTISYPVTNPKIKLASAIIASEIIALTSTVTTPSGSAIKYTVMKDNTEYWWTGTAWAAVATAYTDSNDLADIVNNIDTLFTQKAYFNICVYLHSDDGSARPSLSGLGLQYDAEAVTPELPSRCRVYGVVLNGSTGEPQSGVVVSAALKALGRYATGFVLSTATKSVITGLDGKWELMLVDSINQTPANNKYKFTFTGEGVALQEEKLVPLQSEIDYNSLS